MNLKDWKYGKCGKRSCNRLAVCEACLRELLEGKNEEDDEPYCRCCE